MASRKAMVQNLINLGLENAIADKGASVNGYPAILLRWNGKEEYYTGGDMFGSGDDPLDESREQYQQWLTQNFQ